MKRREYLQGELEPGEVVYCTPPPGYSTAVVDGVVHLVTAADGAPKFYKRGNVTDDSGNTVFRKETVEEAVELDVKMRQVWEMHPRQHIIRNTGSFSAKMDATAGTVISLALESHPHLQQELAAVQHERANK